MPCNATWSCSASRWTRTRGRKVAPVTPGTQALVVAACLDAAAALAHLACIAIGAPAYRFMGAGETVVRAVEAGRRQPALATCALAGMLATGAVYALSGAGVVAHLPWTRAVLLLVCAAYLGRALAFPWLRRVFPGNSGLFWRVSSSLCLLAGLAHLYGLASRWTLL